MTATLSVFLAAVLQGATPLPAETRVSIASDGWTLIGSFQSVPSAGRAPAVLLLHGAARDRRAFIGLARHLAQRGIASLRLDLRAEGESTNLGRFEPGRTNPLLEGTDRDVAAALAWLRRQTGVDSGRIGVLGSSYSGEAMAVAARMGSPAAAYVALSPGSFSEASMDAIDPSGRPWWFIASRDERFAIHVVREIPSRSRTARVTIIDGTSHASDILSPHWNYEPEIADWFAARLGGVTTPALWGGLRAGAHRVGFRRVAQPERVIDLWYPTRAGGTAMRLGDYLALSDDLRGIVNGSAERSLAATMTGDSTGLDPALAARTLDSPLSAVRDAPAAPGEFPIVLWTPRYGTTVAQAALSEMLASHGFVVAFARPVATGPMPFELDTPELKQAELARRVDDMSAAIHHLGAGEGTAIGVIAWSYTGEMATAFQMREPRVKLVAGLSTNLLNGWVYQPAEGALSLDSTRLSAAYAMITQRPELPPALLRVTGPAYFVEMPGLTHGSFNALEGYWPSLLGVTRVQRFSSSGPAGIRGYEAVATMLVRLLRHHLGAGGAARLADLVLLSGLEPGTASVRR